LIIHIACDLEEVSFDVVEWVVLILWPYYIIWVIYYFVFISFYTNPYTWIFLYWSYSNYIYFLLLSKSNNLPL